MTVSVPTLEIEYHNEENAFHTTYKVHKYLEYRKRLEQAFRKCFADEGIRQDIVCNAGPPKGYIEYQNVRNWFVHPKDATKRIRYPRLGAFEITLRIPSNFASGMPEKLLVWSKLACKKWPDVERLAADLAKLVADAQQNEDVSDLVKSLRESTVPVAPPIVAVKELNENKPPRYTSAHSPPMFFALSAREGMPKPVEIRGPETAQVDSRSGSRGAAKAKSSSLDMRLQPQRPASASSPTRAPRPTSATRKRPQSASVTLSHVDASRVEAVPPGRPSWQEEETVVPSPAPSARAPSHEEYLRPVQPASAPAAPSPVPSPRPADRPVAAPAAPAVVSKVVPPPAPSSRLVEQPVASPSAPSPTPSFRPVAAPAAPAPIVQAAAAADAYDDEFEDEFEEDFEQDLPKTAPKAGAAEADRARQAEEERRNTERLETERRAGEQKEAQRVAEEQRLAEENQRAEELRLAEDQRQAEVQRKAEESSRRKAEEDERKAEEARRSAAQAADEAYRAEEARRVEEEFEETRRRLEEKTNQDGYDSDEFEDDEFEPESPKKAAPAPPPIQEAKKLSPLKATDDFRSGGGSARASTADNRDPASDVDDEDVYEDENFEDTADDIMIQAPAKASPELIDRFEAGDRDYDYAEDNEWPEDASDMSREVSIVDDNESIKSED